MKTPLIGITMDSEDGGEGAYSKFDWYALRENYCGAVVKSGGLPVPLPHEPELAEQYLELIDGLLITGGAFDVDPSMYGESIHTKQSLPKTNAQNLNGPWPKVRLIVTCQFSAFVGDNNYCMW